MKSPVDIDGKIPRSERNGGWGVLAILAFGLLVGSAALLRWAWGHDRFVFCLVLLANSIVVAILAVTIAPWRRREL